MVDQQTSFQVVYLDHEASVTEHRIQERRLFHVVFTDGRRPLNVIVAKHADGSKFWTSMPEGRQKEASEVGRLITTYLGNKKNNQAN